MPMRLVQSRRSFVNDNAFLVPGLHVRLTSWLRLCSGRFGRVAFRDQGDTEGPMEPLGACPGRVTLISNSQLELLELMNWRGSFSN